MPYDVLVDYESLPEHPIFNKKETMQEVLSNTAIKEKVFIVKKNIH